MGRLTILFLYFFFNLSEAKTAVFDFQVQVNLKNQTFTAKVIRILDGDTMEVLYQNTPIKIRLAHIDCPEKRGSQPFGNNAKIALSDLCFGQIVTVQGEKYDRYKRLIAVIINVKKQVVNQEMIKQGMAWHFKKYSTNQVYANLEIEARRKKIGLWQDSNAVAPWAWRKVKHKKKF
ncbi:thermonuclease family protein [Pedobacter changchengzhani]|nr:thermonuclease family protein [Pedobacter changchengzhani]